MFTERECGVFGPDMFDPRISKVLIVESLGDIASQYLSSGTCDGVDTGCRLMSRNNRVMFWPCIFFLV
jgi:hypothetical protein